MHDPYSYIHEDECTSPSNSVMETSYASSDEGGSPWSGIFTLTKNVVKTINDSAKSLMNELSELESEARGKSTGYDSYTSSEAEGGDSASPTTTVLPLPWEICFQSTDKNLNISIVQREDEPLKEKILALSKDESVFIRPFNENTSNENESMFALDDSRVVLIRRLLDIDSNLGRIHAKVSGRSTIKERIFWMNYFFHCENLREKREKEINDQSIRRAMHDDELDAELVGRPPASCTGFYPRTGKLSYQAAVCGDNDDIVVPALPKMGALDSDDFVMVHDSDFM